MCSNPTRGFRRLLTSSDPETFSQVRGETTIETVLDVPRGQEIPYSPKRHLSPSEIEQIVAGYLAGTTARELGERFEVDPEDGVRDPESQRRDDEAAPHAAGRDRTRDPALRIRPVVGQGR